MELMLREIEKVNKFLDKHTFSVPLLDSSDHLKTNVKVKLTGVKNYISVGNKLSHIQYTLYILPTNPSIDSLNLVLADAIGYDVSITTTSNDWSGLRLRIDHMLREFLKYFSITDPVICTRVITQIEPKKLQESILNEGILDRTTRKIVQDIISIFKYQREGEWGLPEDLTDNEMDYNLPGFEGFSIFLDLQTDENIEGVDVDGDLYFDDDVVYITIISNPKAGYSNLDELTKELNDIVRHELEHIKQHREGIKMPRREPKSHEKYYTQQHELDAQRAGFRKRAKSEKKDLELIVRNWFEKNKHKHKLDPQATERVIQKILKLK